MAEEKEKLEEKKGGRKIDLGKGDKASVLLAKGKDEIADGEEIPPKFYRAVAEVIAFVLSRRRRIAV